MGILLISYGDFEYDGRLRELKEICRLLSNDVYSLSCSTKTSNENDYINEKINIITFCRNAVKICRDNDIKILFIDNRMACICGLLLKRVFPKLYIIQDVRELYLLEERDTLKSKVGCILESQMMKKSDIVIAANDFRAQYMKERYGLLLKPLVYENIRKLVYSKDYNCEEYRRKYESIQNDKRVTLISTAGVDISRTTDKLVKQIGQAQSIFKLLLVGGGSEEDKQAIENIVREKKLNNIYILGKVGQDELKYLINMSDIGVVNYGMFDKNNIYCSSGKIYEFLFEGKPVITTSNPPLVELCAEYKIGVSGNDYLESAELVYRDYSFYKKNVNQYCKANTVDSANKKIVDEIKKRLSVDNIY